ncbi:MAG TPA: iron-containing redox enzyme family protein [Pirellulales bacterium]|nr:iron-containing redox enzyme family protein [Pirellulales bacterium]
MFASIRVPLSSSALDAFVAVGIVSDRQRVPRHLQLFAAQADRVLDEVRREVASGGMSSEAAVEFQQLLVDACARVMCHPIVASNLYLERFAQGVTFAQARHELQQFSVFAAQFDVAQAKLVANAPTADAYEERLKVLLNEKGIPYEHGFEGELTGRWRMETVHFTWLRNMAEGLGLHFEDLGKIWVGLPGTVAFVNATFECYANTDQSVALGASFGIENWAANNLWKSWIAGMQKLNATLAKPVPLGYLTYHDSEEEHHSQATLDELLENFREPWFDSEKFLSGAERILTEGVEAYYISQLNTLPEKGDTWPHRAVAPRPFDPAVLPRLATEDVHA